jgi:hypothetical protein
MDVLTTMTGNETIMEVLFYKQALNRPWQVSEGRLGAILPIITISKQTSKF